MQQSCRAKTSFKPHSKCRSTSEHNGTKNLPLPRLETWEELTREVRQILFPIVLCPYEAIRQWKSFDADSGKDIAGEIRENFIPDLSNWKDRDAFEKAVACQFKDLRTEAPARILV